MCWDFFFFRTVLKHKKCETKWSRWGQARCQKAVKDTYWLIKYVLNRLKTAEMCNGVVKDEASHLGHIPDRFKTRTMCDEAVRKRPYTLGDVPDHFKTQEMCEKAFKKTPAIIEVCSWLVCNASKNIAGHETYHWQTLPVWEYYWMVQRLSKT